MPLLPKPAELVVRPRLLEMIDRGVQGPLTLVSAPAGTGKTVAVATWATSGRAPGWVIWLELGDTGIPVDALWPALLDALRGDGVVIGDELSAVDVVAEPGAAAAIGADIANGGNPVVVVLDCNVELPADTARALHRMLAAASGRLRLVVLSRADPLFPIQRYRLEQALSEIRMTDLAFTATEARELLRRRDVELPDDVVEAVNQRACGWAAGLLLAAMSMAGSPDPVRSAHELSGAEGPVAEYLVAEVLDRQLPVVREVLLRTSLVEILQPGLIEALVGARGRRALALISRGNAFVDEIPTSPGWYRYHPLFRELLAAQLNYETPTEGSRLRSAAADWYADNGLLESAVRTSVAGGDHDAAARYTIEDLAVLAVGDAPVGSPLQLMAALPDHSVGVEASLLRAASALGRDDQSSCAAHLAEAQQGIDANAAESAEECAFTLAVLLLVLAAKGPAADATVHAAVNAEGLLADCAPERVAAHPELPRTIFRLKADALLALGRLDDATAAYEQLSAVDLQHGGERRYADGLGHLALLAAWRGKMRRAVRLAGQASGGRGFNGDRGPSAIAEVALGWVYAETHDQVRARRHVADAIEHGAADSDIFVRVALALAQARIRRASGDLRGARVVLSGAAGDGTPSWLADRVAVEAAKIEIRDGHPAQADDMLTGVAVPGPGAAELVRTEARMLAGRSVGPADAPAIPLRQESRDLSERIDKRLLESQRRLRCGEQAGAIDALERALHLAAPEHIRRPFLDAPSEVRQLLRSRSNNLAVRHAWLNERPSTDDARARRISRHAKAGTPDLDVVRSPVVVEPLTAKEKEVLGHLEQLLTTEEIANVMFVSVNTIRTHVRNILRKLSASRRNEAIRRARELGILDPS